MAGNNGAKNFRPTKAQKQRVIDLYSSSLTKKETQELLAEEFGVSVRTIRNVARDLDLNTLRVTDNDRVMFKIYLPYELIDIHIISSVGGQFQDSYDTLEELLQEEGEDCKYTVVEVTAIHLNDDYYLSLDDISLN